MSKALPKQVQQQIKTAEEIEAKLNEPPEQPVPAEPELKIVDNEPEVAPPVDEPEVPAEPTDDDTGEPTLEQPADESVDYKAEFEKVQHKYDVLNGKYTKEVPRLARQVRDQNSEIGRLQSVTAAVASAPDTLQEQPKPEALLSPEEREEYGPEFLDIISRTARENISPEVAALKEQIDSLQGQLSNVTTKAAAQEETTMKDALTQRVPQWEALNEDEAFVDWLNKLDTRAGATYYELLNKAFQRGDVDTTASFFSEFLTENNRGQELPQEELGEPTEQADPARRPTIPVAQLAAPGQPAGSRPATAPKGKRIWKTSEITAFYNEVQKGRFADKKTEKANIERSIVNAGKEGRVVRG